MNYSYFLYICENSYENYHCFIDTKTMNIAATVSIFNEMYISTHQSSGLTWH